MVPTRTSALLRKRVLLPRRVPRPAHGMKTVLVKAVVFYEFSMDNGIESRLGHGSLKESG